MFVAYSSAVISRPGRLSNGPNNTNRLLPWMFNRLEDLTRSDYAGIPSNALPSASGDALLLELADGEYLFAKAIAGSNSLSWFQVNQDGTLTLYVSTLGEDALTGRLPLLIFRKSSSVYHVFSDAYDSLIAKKAVSASAKERTKSISMPLTIWDGVLGNIIIMTLMKRKY